MKEAEGIGSLSFDFGFNPFDLEAVSEEAGGDMPGDWPLLPLRDTVVYPHMIAPLVVGRDRSMKAVEAAVDGDRMLVVVAQRNADVLEPGPEDLYTIGVAIHVARVLRMPDGTTSILGQGRRRVRIVGFEQVRPYVRVHVEPIDELQQVTLGTEALMRAVLSLFEKAVQLSQRLPEDAYVAAMNVRQPGQLADLIASVLDLEFTERQELLETLEPPARLQRLSVLLARELDVLELESTIQDRVQREVDRSQREFFLREQMRAIRTELGELDVELEDMQELEARIAQSDMPPPVRTRAEKEMAPPQSAARGVARGGRNPHVP